MSSSISHVGIAVRDLEQATREWCNRYGLHVVQTIDSTVEGVRSNFLSFEESRDAGTCVELVEPHDKDDLGNPVARRLARSGEGVIQIAFSVDDAQAAAADLRAAGVKAIDAPPFVDGAGPRALVLPDAANGVVLELLEWGNA
jgi:methylmalonyl-CoA/ethylmalonyl-CoA epimerase